MTEQHAENLYRAFQTRGFRGTCDTCGNSALVFADVATLKCRCFECVVRERLAREEERERQKHRVPLDLTDFCK